MLNSNVGQVGQAELIDQLKRVRARLLTGWTRNACARNSGGHLVDSKSPEAVCWCLVGAIEVESGRVADFNNPLCCVLRRYRPNAIWLSDFNDDCETVEPVVALIDRTIAGLESERQVSSAR